MNAKYFWCEPGNSEGNSGLLFTAFEQPIIKLISTDNNALF